MTNEVNTKPAKSSPAPKAKKERQKGKIGKFFRDLMGEIKKITWPSAKTTWKNFFLVMVIIIVCSAFLYGFDRLLLWLNGLFYGLFS